LPKRIRIEALGLHSLSFIFLLPTIIEKIECERIGGKMRKIVWVLFLGLLLSQNAWSADSDGIVSEVISKSTVSWDGKILPDYDKGRPEVTIMKITVAPGALLPIHRHTVINAGLLLTGELTVITDEGKTLRLKAGDGIIEVVNTLHYGKNEGDRPAQIVVFYAGAAGMPITVTKQAN
jgi:quercetin dioxygenase-like cupin family protein